MKISELKQRKKELGYSNKKVAELSGVPLGTVQKVFSGATEYPRYETLRALAAVLGGAPSEGTDYAEGMEQQTSNPARETNLAVEYGASHRKQGEYTLADYNALPEDQRAELIDGVLYDLAAPTTVHQAIAGEVFYQMKVFRRTHGGDCLPILSPVDVQLDCDERTMVQPDLIVLCDREKNRIRKIYGAPDFVMEVLSPSTRQKDALLKLNKYWKAGVREYWIVDPEREAVTVYDFARGNYPLHYTFGEQVPVAISGEALRIDFAEIREQLAADFGDWKAEI
ncbi:MAG: Uma2 family endonuclease [Mogibacterium sp.]|nr:Uma2 family endonuclease [Mogibacterium sp.]